MLRLWHSQRYRFCLSQIDVEEMMELDISCFTTAGARINGELPIGSSSLLSRTSQKTFHVSYQLVSCEFSTPRMAHSRRGMREAGIFFCPPGRRFTRGAQLASDCRQKEALRGVRKGWSDDERTTEARLDSGVPLQRNGQAYANLGTRAPFKETDNDPWESRNEFTELEPSAASLDMRGRETSLDDSKLNFEREVADEGIAKEADDRAGSRRSTGNDSFDNRNFISDRNFKTNRIETRLREVESDARTDGMNPLSFRTGGNADAFGTRDLLKDDRTDLDAEARKDQRRNDLLYGRQLCKKEDLYEDGESEEQINAARILMDPERSNDRYFPVCREQILKWRDEEEALGPTMNKLVEGDKRELFISNQQRALNVTAGIVDNSRMLKRSKLIAKQIISQSSAMALGFVSQIWVNTALWEVMVLEVKPSLLSGEVEGVLVNDVCQVGDVILVSDESAMESELTVLESEILVGCDLLTEDGYYLGKVRDYSFTLLDGKVTSLEFDSLGFSLVPSNLISTYWLDINEVMEVSSDSLLVKGGAESRARRLTKGILQLPRLQGRAQSKRLTGNRRRKKSPSISQEISYKGKQLPLQTKQLPSRGSVGFPEDIELDGLDRKTGRGDRWLPMDYGSQRKT